MNGNGYSAPLPTIIETAFSVPINGPPVPPRWPFSILSSRALSTTLFHCLHPSSARRPSLFLFSISLLSPSEPMIWKSARRRREQVGVQSRRRDIWVTRERGGRASYKLNLCNYGSNYVGIRAITCAPTARTRTSPPFTLTSSFVTNERHCETASFDRILRLTEQCVYTRARPRASVIRDIRRRVTCNRSQITIASGNKIHL